MLFERLDPRFNALVPLDAVMDTLLSIDPESRERIDVDLRA